MNIDHKNDNYMNKLIIFIVLSVSTCGLYAQNKTIKGRVIDDLSFETLPYVPIMINDTVAVGRTDLNGFFQIEIPVSVKKILLSYVGIEETVIELADTCDEVEVVMLSRAIYDFITPKKVDRLRLKKFKTLPELHKKAFEQGLFKTNKACYTQEFIPAFPEFWRGDKKSK